MNKSFRILVTGGPTRAYLDDVRYLSNYSTGALAHQICGDLKRAKASVAAVVGPTHYNFDDLKLVKLAKVETNLEMYQAVLSLCRTFKPEVVIFSAAVLDFAPAKRLIGKVSSTQKKWRLDLVPAPKIIDEVGKKFPGIKRIGFKLEIKRLKGSGLRRFAENYMQRKGLEALCLNFKADIKNQDHPAYLFTAKGLYLAVANKKQISEVLNRLIKNREL